MLPPALCPELQLAYTSSLLQHPGQMPHSDLGMSAIPLYLRWWGQALCVEGCALGPYVSPKHLSKALLASSSRWCGDLLGNIRQDMGKDGSICIPQAHPRSVGKGSGEAAGCVREGLGASWDFGAGAGTMAGASIAWTSSLQWCLCSQQRVGKHGVKPLLGYIRVTAAECSN